MLHLRAWAPAAQQQAGSCAFGHFRQQFFLGLLGRDFLARVASWWHPHVASKPSRHFVLLQPVAALLLAHSYIRLILHRLLRLLGDADAHPTPLAHFAVAPHRLHEHMAGMDPVHVSEAPCRTMAFILYHQSSTHTLNPHCISMLAIVLSLGTSHKLALPQQTHGQTARFNH